jgi:hypothetical protein
MATWMHRWMRCVLGWIGFIDGDMDGWMVDGCMGIKVKALL